VLLFNDDEIPSDVYNGYTIYTKNGDYVMDVEKSFCEPALVKLTSREYIVAAELHRFIIQSFLVNIEKGKIVEIDKDMIEDPIDREFSIR